MRALGVLAVAWMAAASFLAAAPGQQQAKFSTNVDMPVWSDVFSKAQESLGANAASERIRALVNYLETVQVKR